MYGAVLKINVIELIPTIFPLYDHKTFDFDFIA